MYVGIPIKLDDPITKQHLLLLIGPIKMNTLTSFFVHNTLHIVILLHGNNYWSQQHISIVKLFMILDKNEMRSS